MKDKLFTISISHLKDLTGQDKQQALYSLENGKVLFFPTYSISLTSEEQDNVYNTLDLLDGKHKNLSFNYQTKSVGGLNSKIALETRTLLQLFMQRYAEFANHLLIELLPDYQDFLIWGRTSFRPSEIEGRTYSKRKDDTRLHVDSFPATPVHGHRILRVFSNINPNDLPRTWELGEPFPKVLERFDPQIASYNSWQAKLLYLIKATKTLRSAYDHYQLNLHDKMKLNDQYQKEVQKISINFPANSTWIVFTDEVSHAALKGQFVLEQTFYLPCEAMNKPELSPLKQWEKFRPACFNKKKFTVESPY